MTDSKFIRNFSIIAHIDHGKSTLADRLLEFTKTIAKREMMNQIMDSMDLERERGITIKLNTARMNYTAKDGQEYIVNLIDTPGHVDFTYEVSRSLAACEGVLLIVDASQGIEAQTLANTYLAMEHNLVIIPVINKIDLPGANLPKVRAEIENVIGIPASEAIEISAKEGINIDQVMEAIVKRIPAPSGKPDAKLQALIFDSYYDEFRGVITKVCIKNGTVKKGDKVRMMATGNDFELTELGHLKVKMFPTDSMSVGEVGYLVANIRSVDDSRVGDTVTLAYDPAPEPLPGYKKVLPMVYSGLFPVDADDFPKLRESLLKLQLNDAALSFEPESSSALGFGFRCGFLGLLHREIVQERLEREFNMNLIVTAPSVSYRINQTDGTSEMISNPAKMPDAGKILSYEEPMALVSMIMPQEYVGSVMELCKDRRGEFKNMEYLDETRVHLKYNMPLAEIVADFFNSLKSKTKGYASMDYDLNGFQTSDLVKLDIKLNDEKVDALSVICHKDKAYYLGRALAEKLKEVIPRQMFEIPIQAFIGAKAIARETVRAMRKDVLAKCYGGDISRKRKLLEKQKEGKKRMKSVGSVELPQDAFMAILGIGSEQ